MPNRSSRRKAPSATKYSLVGFRPNPHLDRRIRSLAERSSSTVSAIVKRCIVAHLPVLEGEVPMPQGRMGAAANARRSATESHAQAVAAHHEEAA